MNPPPMSKRDQLIDFTTSISISGKDMSLMSDDGLIRGLPVYFTGRTITRKIRPRRMPRFLWRFVKRWYPLRTSYEVSQDVQEIGQPFLMVWDGEEISGERYDCDPDDS